MKEIDITNFTLDQLKAFAYDLICEKEKIQANLNIINNEISLKLKSENLKP